MDQEKIGNIIKELRKKNNLTQQNLADQLGVTYQAVSKWENGKNIPDIAILKEISKLYNIRHTMSSFTPNKYLPLKTQMIDILKS